MTKEPTAAAYEERYVAFVDVLGFASLVGQSLGQPEIVTQLRDALASVNASASAIRSAELKLEASSFSDTVVLSAPAGASELLRMIEVLDQFSFDLLQRNMLFRGALVRGLVIHTADFLFGPGLVAAYQLESTISFHPRIMLDGPVRDAVRGDSRFERYVVADPYDVPYLNPFARWQVKGMNNDGLQQLVQLQSIIANGLLAGSENPSVGEKYKWLGRKLNRFIDQHHPGALQPIPLG